MMTTLVATQTAFRQAPSLDTALAYLDAAIEEWGASRLDDRAFCFCTAEVRAWQTVKHPNPEVRP